MTSEAGGRVRLAQAENAEARALRAPDHWSHIYGAAIQELDKTAMQALSAKSLNPGKTLTRVGMRFWFMVALLVACFSPVAHSRSCGDNPLRVAIDIGHSRVVPGADSARGKPEYEFNRRYALELLQMQNKWTGLSLFLLETSGKALSLQDRPRLADQAKAEVFLSIHHDSVVQKYVSHWQYNGRFLEYSDVFSGFSLFVYQNSKNFVESDKLANIIGEMMVKIGRKPTLHHAEPIRGEGRQLLNRDLGVYAAPFLVLRSATMPAVLFEVGIIANRQEEERLEDSAQRALSQDALLRALQNYCFTS